LSARRRLAGEMHESDQNPDCSQIAQYLRESLSMEGERSGGDEPTEDFENQKFGLSPAGLEMLITIASIDSWLAMRPGGRLSLAVHKEAHVPVDILLDGWNSGIVPALAAGPLNVTELGLAIDTLSRGSLRAKLDELSKAELLEAQPDGDDGAIYAVTDWLREAVGPLAVGVRSEMRTEGRQATPNAPGGVEVIFLLALPLLTLPDEMSGNCRLLVAAQDVLLAQKLRERSDLTVLDIDPGPTPTQERMSLAVESAQIALWDWDVESDRVWMTRGGQKYFGLKRGEDLVRGNYISYDAVTELFQVSGGNARAAGNSQGDGRVRATIQPKPKTTLPAAPPVTLKPEDAVDTKRGELGVAR